MACPPAAIPLNKGRLNCGSFSPPQKRPRAPDTFQEEPRLWGVFGSGPSSKVRASTALGVTTWVRLPNTFRTEVDRKD